jgi:Concanavalin A-like lectin/glucanases superfamily/PEP-CTERM motif
MRVFRHSPAILATLLALGAALPAQAALVGFYGFDNPSNFGADSSGLNNNLMVFGTGATYTGSGDVGGGLSLSGAGGLTTASGMAPSQFPIGNSSYTLSVDFRTNVSGALGLIGWGAFGKKDSVNTLRTSKTGLTNNWWSDDLSGKAKIHDNQWHTAIASYDGATRTLYIDGALIASDVPGVVNSDNGKNFAVGRTNKIQYFTGTLDNIAVFDTALTPAEVLSAFPALRNVPEPMTIGLLGSGLLLLGWQRRRRTC